jgi:hypothetical protein
MFLKQAVTITGLDTHKFKCSLEGVLLIQSIFAKGVGENMIIPWKPGYYQGQPTMDLANRYFNNAMSTGIEEQVPFHPLVDSNDVLSKIAEEGHFVHTADNEVRYLARVQQVGGEYK